MTHCSTGGTGTAGTNGSCGSVNGTNGDAGSTGGVGQVPVSPGGNGGNGGAVVQFTYDIPDANGNHFRYRARLKDAPSVNMKRWARDVFLLSAP